MSSHAPIDAAQRTDALNPDACFICEAPAGSGKTELLTQRVLTLLARVPQPEAIIAITFTRKAAAEMRERILTALHLGCGAKPAEEHSQVTWNLAQAALRQDRQMGWSILKNPNRLQIRTFDSLCALLNQTLPFHASLGMNIGPAEKPDDLYELAVKEFIETVEHNVPWAPDLMSLLSHLDNNQNSLANLLVAMLKARDSWIPIVQRAHAQGDTRKILEKQLQEIRQEKIVGLHRYLSPPNLSAEWGAELKRLAGFAAANLIRENIASPIQSLSALEWMDNWPGADETGALVWLGLKNLLLTQTGTFRALLDKRCGFPVGVGKEKDAFKQQKEKAKNLIEKLQDNLALLDALQDIEYWPSATYPDAQWDILQSLLTCLPVALAHLKVVFARQQEIDFIEMSERARDALGDEHAPTELALRLDQRIEHILVDEFQDTSFGQVELLAKLTLGWQAGDGRTLFCVGDAMQSIYGFRGAKVGLFLHCKQHGLGDIPLRPIQLVSNFRSQGKLVRWVNTVFQHAFPPHNDIAAGAVAYSTADDFRADLACEPVQIFCSPSEVDSREDALFTIGLIHKVWQEDRAASIAVLVRNRGHASAIVSAAREAGLGFRAVDLIPLTERQPVQDLLMLTKALLDPANRIAWFAVLRAPWCGLTLDDLLCLSPENGVEEHLPILAAMQRVLAKPLSLPLSADGRKRLEATYAILSLAFAHRERRALRQWVEGVWVALDGPSCLATAADVADVQRYWQMLQKLTHDGGSPSEQQLDRALADLYAAPDPDADERLQIMTIHKSKGLEFDVVILPELHRQPRGSDAELMIWSDRVASNGGEHWVLAPINATGASKDPIYRFVQREQKQKAQFEVCRLLYVACTRAKKQLFLMGKVRQHAETGEILPPPNGSLFSFIWPSVAQSITRFADKSPTPQGDIRPAKAHVLKRLAQSRAKTAFASEHLLQAYITPFEYHNQDIRPLLYGLPDVNEPALVGTFVHSLLQSIGEQGVGDWQGRNLAELEPGWSNRLQTLGLSRKMAEGALPRIKLAIHHAIHNTRWVALLRSATCHFEYDVSQTVNGKIQRLIIDLFCDLSDGNAAIVDYKTSAPSPNQPLGEFLNVEREQYATALRLYRDAILDMGYRSVQVSLYFVMIDEWLDVDVVVD